MKWFRSIAAVGLLVAMLLFGVQQYCASRLQRQVSDLENQRDDLMQRIARLCASRRVAQITVLDQYRDDLGRTCSKLQWQEIRDDGLLAPPMLVNTIGGTVYFEALVVKFDHEKVAGGDPENPQSLAVFRRVFGEHQAPEAATDVAANAATLLALNGPLAGEGRRWEQFWQMVEDPEEAARYGVRSAQCEAVGAPLKRGQIWEVTLDAAGGLNLKKLAEKADLPPTLANDRSASRTPAGTGGPGR
jgi:hypothetical protein